MTGTPKPTSEHPIDRLGAAGHNPFLDRLAVLSALVSQLFTAAEGARFGFSLEAFTGLLAQVLHKYMQPEDDESRIREFLLAVHVQELVLARACASGHEVAWDVFLGRFREPLYDAGMAIAKDESLGRELADSLYADLCGAGAHSTSPLNSYMGYGSLEGWLRTIMARSFIDRYRSERRLVSLEEDAEEGIELAAPAPNVVSPVDPRLEEATDEAFSELDAEERFILASFFLHERTLAELAKILRLHESTVSRRIQKITVTLRKQIIRGMMRRGMSRRQADEALETDVRDLQTNVRARLQENLQETPSAPSPTQDASTQKGNE